MAVTTIDRTWYNTLVDDDGTGTTGSVWDKADVDALLDAVDLMMAGPWTGPIINTSTGTHVLGAAAGYTAADILELHKLGDAGFGLTNTRAPGNTTDEAFIVGWAYHAGSAGTKLFSISAQQADTTAASGYNVLRINVPSRSASVETSDISFVHWGGHGVAFWPVSSATTYAPGDRIIHARAYTTILDQVDNDGNILELRSSDIAHGVTDYCSTDTYGYAKKYAATTGGLRIVGLSEDKVATNIWGIATTGDTTKGTTAVAPIQLEAYKKSGTGTAGMGANENLLTIGDATAGARYIFDVEGSAHADVEWTTFDAYDDVALITALETHLTADPLKEDFGRWATYNREALERARLVTFNPDGHHFLNTTRLHMAVCGAIRQLAARLTALEAR